LTWHFNAYIELRKGKAKGGIMLRNLVRSIPLLAIPALILLCGCTYKADIRAAPAVNIYSSYEGKIPGTVFLVMDKGAVANTATTKPSTYACSIHQYTSDPGDALLASVRQTTEALFESVVEKKQLPTADEMREAGAAGYIFIKVSRYAPRLRVDPGMFTGSASATAEIGVEVTAKDAANKTLLSTMVAGTRTADGDAGANCDKAATVLADAVAAATQEAMERYAERVSNSQPVRIVFEGGRPLMFVNKQ
jgi:hypothetical protein